MDLKEKYREYLKSDDWKQKRAAKLRKKNRCAICGSRKRLDVHHLNYRRWTDVQQSDLRVLCRACHETAHRLMNDGTLVFTTSEHHSKFQRTTNAVRKARGIQRFCSAEPKPAAPTRTARESHIVTKEWLRKHATIHGAWTRAQLAVLGVAWPPPKGWQRDIAGTSIGITDKKLFECGGRAVVKSDDDAKLFAWMNRPQ
jgi:hypothetical protein